MWRPPTGLACGVGHRVGRLATEHCEDVLVHVPSAPTHARVGDLGDGLMHQVVQVRARRGIGDQERPVDVRDADGIAPVTNGQANVPTVVRPVGLIEAVRRADRILNSDLAEVTGLQPSRRSLRDDAEQRVGGPAEQPDRTVVRPGPAAVDDVVTIFCGEEVVTRCQTGELFRCRRLVAVEQLRRV